MPVARRLHDTAGLHGAPPHTVSSYRLHGLTTPVPHVEQLAHTPSLSLDSPARYCPGAHVLYSTHTVSLYPPQ